MQLEIERERKRKSLISQCTHKKHFQLQNKTLMRKYNNNDENRINYISLFDNQYCWRKIARKIKTVLLSKCFLSGNEFMTY